MDKLEFIARQLSKAQTKKYEHYVVHRIWHRLDDPRLKLITQQFVSRPTGRAMTDMYFPQLSIHVEINEPFHLKQVDADVRREADIINATSHEVLKIPITKDLAQVNAEIDKAITRISEKAASIPDFVAWDPDAEMSPQTYIAKGYMSVEEDVAFRTMADAASCFGRQYPGLQLSFIPHPSEQKKYLWFPKLYENAEWDNTLSKDETTITEKCKIPGRREAQVDKNIQEFEKNGRRLVFARVKGPLGDLMYRFKGEYELDLTATNYSNGAVLRRIHEKARTYSPRPT